MPNGGKQPGLRHHMEFGVLCCLTTPGLRKDIRHQSDITWNIPRACLDKTGTAGI